MVQVESVQPREGTVVWIAFSDGAEGEVDLSDLAGHGVFKAWADRGFFETVHIGPGGSVAWNDEIELCGDSLYLRLTGSLPASFSARSAELLAHA